MVVFNPVLLLGMVFACSKILISKGFGMSSLPSVNTKSAASFQPNRSVSKSSVEQKRGASSVVKTFESDNVTATDALRFNARHLGYLTVKNISQLTETINPQGKTATFGDSLSRLNDAMTSVSGRSNTSVLREETKAAADTFMKELFAAVGSQSHFDSQQQKGSYLKGRENNLLDDMSAVNENSASYGLPVGTPSPLLSSDARGSRKLDYLEFTNVISKYLDSLIFKLSTETLEPTNSSLLGSASDLISTHEISATSSTLTKFLQKLQKNMASSMFLTGNIIDARV